MVYKNAFFQLVIKEDGVYVKVFPARNGGAALNFDELTNYLNVKKITYDLAALHAQVIMAHEPALIKLNVGKTYPESEKLIVHVSPDKMEAVGRFIAPSTGGKPTNKDEIMSDLNFLNIKFGIDEKAIENYLANREYCTDIVLAKGKPVRQGHDAVITYHFKPDRTSKPRVNEDGSVDFHDLDMISKVEKGDVLATLEKEDEGDPGKNVYGDILKPATVKHLVLRHGKNITVSEDGLTMTTDVSGHVMLENDQVFVSNTYEVPANVDNSTGDIEYDGNVEVKGNVITGFSVKASGDVIVNGVVEGAKIEAGGQIILKRGVQGMEKAVLTAGSNVISKFIESAKVKSGGYVTADAIMHSEVIAKGDITVEGKKGFVTGGLIRSGSAINVKTAGSNMGTKTVLEVGIDPAKIDEYYLLEKKIEDGEKEKLQGIQLITLFKKKLDKGETLAPDKMLQYKMAVNGARKIQAEIDEAKARHEALKAEMDSFNRGYIVVRGTAFNGVKISISNAVYYVKKDMEYCRFVKEGADVKLANV